MVRIARDVTTDRRGYSLIRATIHATKVYVTFNNFVIKLTSVEARRLSETLSKCVEIQESHQADKHGRPQG